MKKSLIVLSLGITILAGCKTSTSPNSISTTITPPHAGSYFIVVSTTTDSTGAVTVDTEKDLVIFTNSSIYGETGVTGVIDSSGATGGWSPDTNYLVYTANGDVQTYETFSNTPIASQWITISFGSQTSSTVLNIDSSFFPFSRTKIVEAVSGAGTGNVTVAGQSLQTEKVVLTASGSDTVTFPSYKTDTYSSSSTLQFAPTIGYLVETDVPAFRSGGYLNPAQHSQLIRYHLQ